MCLVIIADLQAWSKHCFISLWEFFISWRKYLVLGKYIVFACSYVYQLEKPNFTINLGRFNF